MKKLSILALLLATQAHAGTVLRAKQGPVNTANLAALSSQLNFEGTSLFLVQWKDRVHESEKAELGKLGLQILNYFPDDAFLVKGSAEAAKAAEKLGFVRVVMPYHAGFKLERGLAEHAASVSLAPMEVSVQLAPGADVAVLAARFDEIYLAQGNLLIGKGKAGNLVALASDPNVIWIEKYLPLRSMDMDLGGVKADSNPPTRTGFESGVKILNLDGMYAKGIDGRGQIVAVADTGLDTGDASTLSADFQGQLKIGLAMGLGGHSWGDPEMHGTHVSGSILGNGHNSQGLIRGGAYGAQLVMMGMWSDIMNNIMPPTLDKLYQAGYDNGARIQSNSWGSPNSMGRYDNWAQLTDTWLFNHPDYLAMFAAGNDGADLNGDGVIDEGSVGSPGTAKNVLTVGASKNYLLEGGIQKVMKDLRNGTTKWAAEPIASSRLSEDQKGLAAFSSRGPTADGRIKPEIVAPGTNIVSVRDKHPKADPASMSWGIYDDNYVYMGGTSMATPVAAGGVAVLRQYIAQQMGRNDFSAALLKAAVANTADDLFPGQFGETTRGQEEPSRRPNNHEGWGRVDLQNVLDSSYLYLRDDQDGLATGQSKTYSLGAVDFAGSVLRVTMAYTDAPGTAAASAVLVNDLDLTVITPDGQTLYPNGRSSKDSVNNMEQIDVLHAIPGEYKVVINAASVPSGKNGKQPYALVVTKRAQ